jgi:hypothetical protein
MLLARQKFKTDDEVLTALRECAEALIEPLVFASLCHDVNDQFVRAIAIKGSPETRKPSEEVMPAIAASAERVADVAAKLNKSEVERLTEMHRKKLGKSLADESWLKEFPGRRILKLFTDRHLKGKINSTLFMNAVLDKMVERGVKPAGMDKVLNDIATR